MGASMRAAEDLLRPAFTAQRRAVGPFICTGCGKQADLAGGDRASAVGSRSGRSTFRLRPHMWPSPGRQNGLSPERRIDTRLGSSLLYTLLGCTTTPARPCDGQRNKAHQLTPVPWASDPVAEDH
eukprot:scaffold118900_cov70-Phaeocystis_antarctica.AAC.2